MNTEQVDDAHADDYDLVDAVHEQLLLGLHEAFDVDGHPAVLLVERVLPPDHPEDLNDAHQHVVVEVTRAETPVDQDLRYGGVYLWA